MAPTKTVPVVETPSEETLEVGVPGRLEDPCEVAAAATGIASASEGGLGAGRSEEPERLVCWAMVQPGIPPVFDRNERWEHEVWGSITRSTMRSTTPSRLPWTSIGGGVFKLAM